MELWLDLPPFGENENKEIGKNIRYYRKKKGWTQEQLAEAVYRDPTLICKHERGKQVPGIDVLIHYSAALGCSLQDILPRSVKAFIADRNDPLMELIAGLDSKGREQAINYIRFLSAQTI